MPEIWYLDENNKQHRYFPDIYIPSKNLVIEVKSEYIFKKQIDKNVLKAQVTRDAGYNFQFWICDKERLVEIIE